MRQKTLQNPQKICPKLKNPLVKSWWAKKLSGKDQKHFKINLNRPLNDRWFKPGKSSKKSRENMVCKKNCRVKTVKMYF